MPIDPFFGAIGAAGISSAAQIAGGFLSRPDHSERDLMWESAKIQEHQLRKFPKLQMEGLRSAGLNPMLAMMKGSAAGHSAVSIPNRMEDPVGRGVSQAGHSAAKGFEQALMFKRIAAETANIEETNRKIRAETNNIASQTILNSARTATETVQPSLIESQRELNSARNEVERQNLQKRIVETAIAKHDLTVAEKEAVIASIDIDMYSSTVGEVSRWLEKLGIEPRAAVGMAHALWNLFRNKPQRR